MKLIGITCEIDDSEKRVADRVPHNYSDSIIKAGGIPVIIEDGKIKGVEAVIDKDFASATIAELLDVDYFVIVTAVDKVSINFNKPDQKDLDKITVEEAEKYIREGHFAPGSMLPKIQAAIHFARSKPNRKAIITSIKNIKEAILGNNGTTIEG